MRGFVVLGVMALLAVLGGRFWLLPAIAFLALVLGVAIIGWRSGRRGPQRGHMERRPDASVRPQWDVRHPTFTEVGRAYRSVRRARGLSGDGWLPRRPRL